MFRNLLVPLDGSGLAESALPWAWWLAARFGAKVTLLHVIERRAPRAIHGETHLREPGEAGEYLEALVAGFPEGLRAEIHVHTVAEGDLAASIARHTSELDTDLVVLSAHGRPGARGMLLGGVAQQVLRQATAPVLLLRPGTPSPGDSELDTVLVPLDGTPEAEAALPYASELAARTNASLLLLMVVPTVGTIRDDRAALALVSPLATAAVLDAEQENAVAYVRSVIDALCDRGMRASAEVGRGDAVALVSDAAARADVSLVAMASHGRSGFSALWSASVGAGVLGRVEKPILLVNPTGATAATGGEDPGTPAGPD
jgi:nucleotide-binding universal stress UspA family protein